VTGAAVPPPPPAARGDVVDDMHGVAVPDPYRWLDDGASVETLAWSEAQNDRTRTVLDAVAGRDVLRARLGALFGAGAAVSPTIRPGVLLSLDRWDGRDQHVLVVRSLEEPEEVGRVLVDPAAGGDATAAIDWYHPSPDGTLVTFGTSTGGDERSTLRVVRVVDASLLPDEIPHTRAASVGWDPDGSGFAYSVYPPGDEYHRHIRRHRLGTDVADDTVVFGPDQLPEPEAWPDVSRSRDGRWYLVHVELGWTRTDVHLLDAATLERTTVIEGVDAVTWLQVVGDRLVGTTTLGAGRGRVVAAAVDDPAPERWTTLVPEGEGDLEGVAVTRTALLVSSTLRAVGRLDRYDHGGGEHRSITLPGLGSVAGVATDQGLDEAVVGFTSFAQPSRLLRWEPTAGIRPCSALPGAPAPDAITVHQTSYTSTDGTEIPLFLVTNRGGVRGLGAPLVLNGYGGFAITMSPAYSPLAVAHVEGGGVWAVACIRGGAEQGEAWHRAGMREHKQQVFDDFHAAADHLVETGWAQRDRLAIRGGSNGGLLVGAAVTQRPDLCRAVICAVPLLDMVRFPQFLIARLWVSEYGNPDVAEEFAWLHAYSPYHRVVDGTCYPATLLLTATEDSRVDPCHARKFAALLQSATSCGDERPVLVRIEAKAGHGVGKPVAKQADEAADVLAFLAWQLGGD
jgi:prolyl oligopeptidase